MKSTATVTIASIPPLIVANLSPPDSPARTRPRERAPLRVAAVQQGFDPDPAAHRRSLADGVRRAAAHGAELICLQELTLSPYFAITPDGPAAAGAHPEELESGPTRAFAAELAAET